jgi:chemotaxis protein MotB
MMQSARGLLQRTGRPLVVAAGALLGAGLMVSNACVSSGRYKTLEQERDALAGKNQTLRADLDAANQRSDGLTQEKAALASEKSALEQRLADLDAQQKTLGSQLQQREEEAGRLKSTYDGLVTNLKKELEAGQIQVQQMRDGLSVNVAQEILFASGSAALDKGGREVLQRVSEQLKQTNYQIVVTGHTDNKPIGKGLEGRYPTNWELSGARAASVVRLFAENGIPTARLAAVGMADTRSVAPNDSPEGRARNRRIEIRLRPVVVED